MKRQQAHCVNEADAAFQMIQELDERARQAKRLSGTALELFFRRLKITAHKGTQGNWNPKSVCADVKAELKRCEGTSRGVG